MLYRQLMRHHIHSSVALLASVISAQIVTLFILHIFFPLSKNVWKKGICNGHLELSVVQVYLGVSDGWSENVLVKNSNNVSVCAPNTIICWELLGY